MFMNKLNLNKFKNIYSGVHEKKSKKLNFFFKEAPRELGMQEEEERAVTPPLRREEGAVPQAAEADAASGTAGVAGNDTGNGGSEDDSNEEEQEETGKTWGHAKLPPDVYDSNPFHKSRGNTQYVVWNVVKCLKKHTTHGTTVDVMYTHVCTAQITVKKEDEEGDDQDDDGN